MIRCTRKLRPVWSFIKLFFPALMVFFLFGVIFNLAIVKGDSMDPTLQNSAIILTQRALYTPKRGDIIVFHVPGIIPDTIFVKRVIGIAGDEIDIDFETGEVYRNGELLQETYIAEPTTMDLGEDYPLTVKEGHVFVMGDNRNHSFDSRSPDVGQIPTDKIIGGYLCTLKK